MKRTALLATVALVAVSPAVAHAAPGKPSSRTVMATYTAFGGASTPAASFNVFNVSCKNGVGNCFTFATAKGEIKVVITVTDNSARPVGFQVFQGGVYQGVQTFCGTTTLDLSPKAANQIDVRQVLTADCAGVPTTGTLKAVISTKK